MSDEFEERKAFLVDLEDNWLEFLKSLDLWADGKLTLNSLKAAWIRSLARSLL